MENIKLKILGIPQKYNNSLDIERLSIVDTYIYLVVLIAVVVMTVGDVMVTVRWVVVQDAHCSSASPSVSGFGGTETEPAPTINHHDPHCKILISTSPHCIDKPIQIAPCDQI